jgi:hypothetical protein
MAKPDYTRTAVQRQLKGFSCEAYEVGVLDGRAGDDEAKMNIRVMASESILKSLPYYKKMNATGHHIFVRPQGSQGFVFFDDLNQAKIKRMTNDGIEPALLIESSPFNFHGWIKVSDTPIPANIATACSKVIAGMYGGDKDAAAWRQFGRLVGFTNQKPKYVSETGQYPFVMLRSANGKICSASETVLTNAQTYLREKEIENQLRLDKIKDLIDSPVITNIVSANEFFESELRGIEKRFGASLNASKADWMIVNKMLKKGFSVDSIKYSLAENSLKANRHNIDTDKYITITMEKALTSA